MGIIREVARVGLRTIVKRNHYYAGYNDGLLGNSVSPYPLIADKIFGQREDPLMEEGEMYKYYMIGYTAGQTDRISQLENKSISMNELDKDRDEEYIYETTVPYEIPPLSESDKKFMIGTFSVLGSMIFTVIVIGVISITLGSVESNYLLNFYTGCFFLITYPCLLAIFSITKPLRKDDENLEIKRILYFILYLTPPIIGACLVWNIHTGPINCWFIFSYQRNNIGEWLTWGKWLALIPIGVSTILYFVKTRDL